MPAGSLIIRALSQSMAATVNGINGINVPHPGIPKNCLKLTNVNLEEAFKSSKGFTVSEPGWELGRPSLMGCMV